MSYNRSGHVADRTMEDAPVATATANLDAIIELRRRRPQGRVGLQALVDELRHLRGCFLWNLDVPAWSEAR